MSIPLSQFAPAQDTIDDRNPSFDTHSDDSDDNDDNDDEGSIAPTLAEHEPFITDSLPKRDDTSGTLESQQTSGGANRSALYGGLATVGVGLASSSRAG